MEQALADEAVARLLFISQVEDAPYYGRPPVDAAVAKLQQAAEKALKASILACAPEAAHLVFAPHRILSERRRLPTSRRFRALVEKISYARFPGGLRQRLEQLERYAPRPEDALVDSSGSIIELPLNTEYPSRVLGREPQAPALAWAQHEREALELSKAVRLLFRILKGVPELRRVLADFPDEPLP